MTSPTAVRVPLPLAFRRAIPAGPILSRVNSILDVEQLNTICISGKCPNRGECFSRGSLAFMILGNTCTRHCGFCAVKAGHPGGVIDWAEPDRLARSVAALQLRHAVITSVARDDLADGGASIFAACIREVKRLRPETVVEVLVPDFQGDSRAIDTVLAAGPDIFNHNIETVERLTPQVRSKATYRRSLEVLRYVKRQRDSGENRGPVLKIKSGLMLGLGESPHEVHQALEDLRGADCDYLTIGQYLQPSARNLAVRQFVPVHEFAHWKEVAHDLGFERVASGPLVRSSYFADELHARGDP